MKTYSDSDISYHFIINNAFNFCWLLGSVEDYGAV